MREKCVKKIVIKDDDVSIQTILRPPRAFLRNKDLRLVGRPSQKGYITMNNTIKIKNVGIFYPFPVLAVG